MATDSYTVEAKLEFTSNAPETVEQLLAGFEDLDSLITETRTHLSQFATDLRDLSSAERGATRLLETFEQLAEVRLGSGLFDDLAEVRSQVRGINSLQERLTSLAADTAEQWAAVASQVERAGQAMRSIGQAEAPTAARGTRAAQRQAAEAMPAGQIAQIEALSREMQTLGASSAQGIAQLREALDSLAHIRIPGSGLEAAALGGMVSDMERAVGFARDLAGTQDQIARTAAEAAGSWKEIADATRAASGRAAGGAAAPGAAGGQPSVSPPPPLPAAGENWAGIRRAANGRAIGPDGRFISNADVAMLMARRSQMLGDLPNAEADNRAHTARARQNSAVLMEQRQNADAENRDYDLRQRAQDKAQRDQERQETQDYREAWTLGQRENADRTLIAKRAAMRRKEFRHQMLDLGIGLQMGGDSAVGFFSEGLAANFEVQHLLTQFKQNTTITPDQVADVRRTAEANVRKIPGTTVAENVEAILDAYTVTGNVQEAIKAGAAMSRLNLIFSMLPGRHHGDPAFAAMQSVELMQRFYNKQTGDIDLGEAQKQMNAMAVVAANTGGRVQPNAYLSFAKQARAGGMLADDRFLYHDLPALLIALGGSRAGTGEAATYRQFIQGRMTQNAFGELQKMGFVDKSAVWEHGQVKDMLHHLAGAEEYIENPVQWMRDVGARVYKQNGIDLYNPADRLKLENENSQWASTSVGLGWFSELALGIRGIDKESKKIDEGNQDPLSVISANDPLYQTKVFKAAWNDFLVSMGDNLMGPALASLRGLTDVVRELTAISAAHPHMAAGLETVAAGLAVLAKAAGDTAMVIFFGAPLVKGFVSLASALSPFSSGGGAATGLEGLVGGLAKLGGWLTVFGFLAEKSRRDAFQNLMPGDPHAQAEAMVGEPLPPWASSSPDDKTAPTTDNGGGLLHWLHDQFLRPSSPAGSQEPALHTPAVPPTLAGGPAAPLLDMLGGAEGTDKGRSYDETLGYGKFTNGPVKLTDMSLAQVADVQRQMIANHAPSTAVGRYQIIDTTLQDLTKKLHLDPNTTKFSPAVQDRMARELLREEGADAFASGSLSAGDFLHNLSKQWASLPDPALGGLSHYGQRVGVPMDDALAQLAATKALAAQAFAPPGGAPNLLPPSAPLGATDPTALQPPSGQTIQLRGDLRIDGRKHGEYTANSLADRLTTPPSGPTQPNLRLTPGFVSAIPSFGGT